MFDRIKTRLASEEGFTLIELLVVIVILGILIAIAVPAYLSLTGSAHNAAAGSNVRSAIPAAETIYEQQGDYSTMSPANLVAVAPGVNVADAVSLASGAAYCIDSTSGTTSYDYVGGDTSSLTFNAGFKAATIQPGLCSAATS